MACPDGDSPGSIHAPDCMLDHWGGNNPKIDYIVPASQQSRDHSLTNHDSAGPRVATDHNRRAGSDESTKCGRKIQNVRGGQAGADYTAQSNMGDAKGWTRRHPLLL
jgi:hypothetical protein